MDNITYAVSVDVNNPIIPYNVYVASVLDSNVRYLEITLYQNGNIIALSNTATATASLVTDNVIVNDSVNCTISNNIITVPLEDLQRHGNLDVQVTVTEGTKVLAIPFPIQVRVTPNIAENAQVDENSLGSYAEVVQEIAAARGSYTTLEDSLAAKLPDSAGAVKTANIDNGAVTLAKLHSEVIDSTLSVQGAAADAKKTGDGITDLKSALNNLDAGAIKYMAHDKIDILRFVEWENGYYVGEATGDLISNSRFYYTDYISLSDFVTLLHVVTTSSHVIKYAVYDEDKTYIMGNSFSSATDYERDYGSEAKYIRLSVGAWYGSNTLEDYLKTISLFVIPSEDVIKNEFIGWQQHYLTWDSYIRTPSVGTTNVATTQSAIGGCASIAIPCNKGDVFNITGTPRDNSGFRPIMFLNGNNKCVYRSEQTTAFNQYEYIAPENGTIVINLLTSSQPVVYTGLKNVSDAILKNKQAINEVRDLLAEAATPDDVFEILDSTMSGNPNVAPSLRLAEEAGEYKLVYEDSNEHDHVLVHLGDGIENLYVSQGDLYANLKQPDGTIIHNKLLGRVRGADGANGTNGTNGSGYSDAEIDANGDLLMTEKKYIQGEPAERVVNLGHVKGADAVVDPTLTVSGAAADAKKTGDGITDLKSALNNLDAGAIKYMAHDKIDILRFVEWENGYYVGEATGDLISNSRFYYTDYISLSDFVTLLHVVTTSSHVIKYAVYDEDKTYIMGNSFSSATDYERDYGSEAKYIRLSVGAWYGSNTLEDYLKTISLFVIPSEDVIKNEFIGWQQHYLTWDSYIRTPSVGTTNVATTQSAIGGCASIAIPCNKGDVFNITGTPRDNSGFRPIMFLNGNNKCVYRSEQTTAFNQYEYIAPENGTIVINLLTSSQPVVYTGLKNVSDAILKNKQAINIIETAPIDVFPSFMINAMAVRRVGELKKGYICLTCDDGAAELASYTIPMLLAKDVPCTFGLWASTSKIGAARPFNKSVILQSTAGIEALESALENGCEVAQHGPIEWTELTNEELNSFFDREATAWERLGITVKGAICPSHCINNKVRVIAGGRFGVLRSGYRGYLSKADQQAIINGDVYAEYNYYCTGARSNEFGLSSFNTNAVTLDWMKAAVDYALSQKMVNIVYWHDWDLTSDQKADLEALIDYAKAQNITFCTLSEIPYLK